MKILCIFAQPKCDYPGQYAPELVGAIDEISDSDNPEYLQEVAEDCRKDPSIEFYKTITMEISDEEFAKAFNPSAISAHIA